MADEKKIENENPVVEEKKEPSSKEVTVEELMAQLAQAEAEKARLKNANDKLSKSEANMKKQLREKMSAEEQANEAKKEADELNAKHLKELEDFKNLTLATERYQIQGMDIETAKKAAKAEIDADFDLLSTIQKQYNDLTLKRAKSEWLASRPDIASGTSDGKTVTIDEFQKMGIAERTKLKRNDPDTYAKLVKQLG